MDGRWDDDDAGSFVRELARTGDGATEALAWRTYSSRLLGQDPALVLHGGGNTSVKARARTALGEEVDVLFIKGSGWDLATIDPAGHPAARMDHLLRLLDQPAMTDEVMVNGLRLALLDAAAPTPSVEALLHAALPYAYIDHTHADAVLAVADQERAREICLEIYGAGLVFVPYVMPGFGLAKRCAEAHAEVVAAGVAPTVMILERHGIFTFGATAKESYARMIDMVTRAERHRIDRMRTVAFVARDPDLALAQALLPALRGALAASQGLPDEAGPILALRTGDRTIAMLDRPDAADLLTRGCATPDHVIRTKPWPLLVDATAVPPAALREHLLGAIRGYAARYEAYFRSCREARGASCSMLDPWPRVVLVPGVGVVTVGSDRRQAAVAADIHEHTIDVILAAEDVGAYSPVSTLDLFDVEYWSLEQAKLRSGAAPPGALRGKIALVTGAASGIGEATARAVLEAGMHVVLTDRDPAALSTVRDAMYAKYRHRLLATVCDVTEDAAVATAMRAAVFGFGGLDVVVSNAGAAAEGRVDTPEGIVRLRASLDLNLLSHARVASAASRVFEAQGTGGCLLFNASKSALNPGPGFGPYAVAKASLVALMRQYAIDLAPFRVRSNAVNADRVRTGLFTPDFVASRAKARGVGVDDYFRANLLGREVTARDVAQAFAYLATARSTTGAILTVDGGNAAAFVR